MSAPFAAPRAIAQRIFRKNTKEHRMKTIMTILLALSALSALPRLAHSHEQHAHQS
jgi:hypothetical protein